MTTTNTTTPTQDLRRAQLLARLEADYELHTRRLTEMVGVPVSDPEEAFTRDSLAATSRQALASIAAALSDVAQGRYGICEACNTPIPVERLEARPEARYCVSCQARRER